MDREKIPAVVVVITNIYGQVLLLNRNVKPFGWCLPGGKIEDGEEREESAIREVKEETNLTIRNLRYLGPERSENGRKIYIYHTDSYIGDIGLSREHSEYRWVYLSNLTEFDLAGRTMEFINRYILYYQ